MNRQEIKQELNSIPAKIKELKQNLKNISREFQKHDSHPSRHGSEYWECLSRLCDAHHSLSDAKLRATMTYIAWHRVRGKDASVAYPNHAPEKFPYWNKIYTEIVKNWSFSSMVEHQADVLKAAGPIPATTTS